MSAPFASASGDASVPDFVWPRVYLEGYRSLLHLDAAPRNGTILQNRKAPAADQKTRCEAPAAKRKNAAARRNDTQGPSPSSPERGYGACHSSSAGWRTSGDFHPKGRAWVARFGSAWEYLALSRDPSAPGAVNVIGEIHGFRCSGHPNISFYAA